MPALGTKFLLLIFTSLQILALFYQFFNYLSRKQDQSRLRFMLMIFGFVLFNVLNLLSPNIFGIGLMTSKLVSYIFGVLFAVCYLLFIFKEFSILTKKNDTNSLVWILSVTLCLGYFATQFIIGTWNTARNVLVFLPTGISLAFCAYMQIQFRKNIDWSKSGNYFKLMSYSSYLGLVLLTSIPLFIYIGYYNLNLSLINLVFICTISFYFRQLLTENKKEFQVLDKMGYFLNEELFMEYNLTKREKELTKLILTDLTFPEIGEIIFRTAGTISSQASSIYRKTGCKNRVEFREKFQLKQNDKLK